jgi:8-oxo-dGTP diphosphatase
MAHIHQGDNEHDATVSMYIVSIKDPEHPRLFLHQHKVAGRWFQPGGHVELGESPWQAVVHELREETGFELDQLAVLQSRPRLPAAINGQLLPTPFVLRTGGYEQLAHFHDDLLYAFITEQEPRLPLAEDESQEIAWFTLEELEAIPDAELYMDIKPLGRWLLTGWREWDQVPTDAFVLGPQALPGG